uniref:Cep112_1 protein n=1 Tax=Fopius arisanus TaxID=64838 RepID=A0A0C9QRU6_9HYME
MNSMQLSRYIKELIQVVNTNVVLANDISKNLGLPVSEALKQFNADFDKILLNNTSNSINNGEIINDNRRLLEEINYINNSSREQKINFVKRSDVLKNNIEILENSLESMQNDYHQCNEKLEKSKNELEVLQKQLSLCNNTNDKYIQELNELKQQLFDESETYRQRVDASNAISEIQLSDIERDYQIKMNKYVNTITELKGKIYQLTSELEGNNEGQQNASTHEEAKQFEIELNLNKELLNDTQGKLKETEMALTQMTAKMTNLANEKNELLALLRTNDPNLYKTFLDKYAQSENCQDLQVLLKSEIKNRDEEIARLSKLIKNIPEIQLNEHIQIMSDDRKKQLIDILTKFSNKITPYDVNLSNKLKNFILDLNRKFNDTYNYIDNIVSILIEINTLGFAKLTQTLDEQTLNELLKNLRTMYDNIDMKSPNLEQQFHNLFTNIETTLAFVKSTGDVYLDIIKKNNKVSTEIECSQYHEILDEITEFRDTLFQKQTTLLQQQISSLEDMKKNNDVDQPIQYFLFINQLQITLVEKRKLLFMFKELIEQNQKKLDKVVDRLRQVEFELSEYKMNFELNKELNNNLQKKVASNEQTIKTLQTELINKNRTIKMLQQVKKQNETLKYQLDNANGDVESVSKLIGSIGMILKKYTNVCNFTNNSNTLWSQINSLNANMEVKSAIDILDSISTSLSSLATNCEKKMIKRKINSQDVECDDYNKTSKCARYENDEEDFIDMQNQQMYMQMMYANKTPLESEKRAKELVDQLKYEMNLEKANTSDNKK